MKFDPENSLKLLYKTPEVLRSLLKELPEEWTHANEGKDTWSPFDITGHLIQGEKTDWPVRLKIILSDIENKNFLPFDRFAQFSESKGKSMDDLIEEFYKLRKSNLDELKKFDLKAEELEKKGIHPDFGEVTVSQLLSAWVVHDLDHIAQIARVMAKQYKEAAGPWTDYLTILK